MKIEQQSRLKIMVLPSLPAPVGLPYQVASAGDQSELIGE